MVRPENYNFLVFVFVPKEDAFNYRLLCCWMDVLALSVDEDEEGSPSKRLLVKVISTTELTLLVCCPLLNLIKNVHSPSFSSSFYLIRRPIAIGSAVYLVFVVSAPLCRYKITLANDIDTPVNGIICHTVIE